MNSAADCRDAADPRLPCCFASICHDVRREVSVRAGLRGTSCPWYQMLAERCPELIRLPVLPEAEFAPMEGDPNVPQPDDGLPF